MPQYDARQFAQEIIDIVKNTPKEELDSLSTEQIIKNAQQKIEAKTPLSLEVQVNEVVRVIDKIMDAIAFVVKMLQDWIFSNSKEPLVITVKKVEARGPPVLGISVGDSSNVKTGLV